MAVHLEITTENLLNAVVQMPENEFKRFVENAKKLRTKHNKQTLSTTETNLILKINSVFAEFPHQKYKELNAKFESDSLSQNEYQELLKMSDEREILNAKRLEYIGELSKIRHQTLEDIMKQLGIKTSRK